MIDVVDCLKIAFQQHAKSCVEPVRVGPSGVWRARSETEDQHGEQVLQRLGLATAELTATDKFGIRAAQCLPRAVGRRACWGAVDACAMERVVGDGRGPGARDQEVRLEDHEIAGRPVVTELLDLARPGPQNGPRDKRILDKVDRGRGGTASDQQQRMKSGSQWS
jgi:hypothetical protein